MFYGGKSSRRSLASSSASLGASHSPLSSSRTSLAASRQSKFSGEHVNRLLSKTAMAKAPAAFADFLDDAGRTHRKCGLSGPFAWAVVNGAPGGGEGLSIAWWKYTNDRGFSAAPNTGMLPLSEGSSVEEFHNVVFYEAAASGSGGPVPSAAVADSKHLTIFRISGEADHDVDRKDWGDVGLKYGGGGAALVALQPEGYLVGCISPGALFILRDDGSPNVLSGGVDVFEDGTLYQRLWGATRKWLQGSEGGAGGRIIGAVLTRSGGVRGVGGGGGESEVLVVTDCQVHRWSISTAGDVNASLSASRHKNALEGSVSQLAGAQVERVSASSGRWNDSCWQILAIHSSPPLYRVHFLAMGDLAPLTRTRASQGFDLAQDESLSLLPPTAPPGGGACVLVSDGRKVYSARPGEGGGMWEAGPEGEVLGCEALAERPGGLTVEERLRKGACSLILTPQSVVLLVPRAIDAASDASGPAWGGKDGGLFEALNNKADARSALQAFTQTDAYHEAVQRIGGDDSVRLLIDAILSKVADGPMDASASTSDAPGTGGGEKRAFEKFLADKARLIKKYAEMASVLFSADEFASLRICLARLVYRVEAARRLLDAPTLFPQASLLSDAIEVTVAMPSWHGENSLRPWAAAWRAYCEGCSRCEDVLTGVLSRLNQVTKERLEGREDVVERVLLEAAHVFKSVFCGIGNASDVAGEGPRNLPVKHIVNEGSVGDVASFCWLTMQVCMQLRHQCLRASPALEDELAHLQMLHVKLLGKASAVGMDVAACENEMAQKCSEYISSWGSEGLGQLDKKIHLAEELCDVAALVSISMEDLSGNREEQEARNDAWASRFKNLGYATALMDKLRRVDVKLLWDPPFKAYDFSQEMSAYIGSGDNLSWVNALRAIEHGNRLGKREGSLGQEQRYTYVAQQILQLVQRGGMEAHQAQTMLSLSKLAGEASRRRAGTLASRPTPPEVTAGLINTRIQMAVRPQGGEASVWDIERATRECAELAAETGDRADRRKLLRYAMLLLGHWPSSKVAQAGSAESGPGDDWKMLFDIVCEAAVSLNSLPPTPAQEQGFDDNGVDEGFPGTLVQEALHGAGMARVGRSTAWPRDTVQYAYLLHLSGGGAAER